MAFWERLFPDRQKKTLDAYLKCGENCSPSKDARHFKEEEIRLLVFRDCSVKGRRLLFDSKSVCKIKINITKYNGVSSEESYGSFHEIVDGFGYKYTSMQNDVKMLGEMMFGCIAMSFCGTMFKVHELDNPHRLMCTMISPVYGKSSKSSTNSAGSSVGSVHDFLVSNNASDSFYELSSDSLCNDVFNASGSSFLSPSNFSSFQESASNSSLSSHGSYLRRCQMSSCYAIDKTQSTEDQSCIFDGEKPKMKLGCAVLFELTSDIGLDEDFLFAHMTIVQQNLSRLMCAVLAAYLFRKTFLFSVLSAFEIFRQSLKDLCTASRINKPVWLTLTSCSETTDNPDELAGQFLTSLTSLQDKCDTKVANFFLSRLLTGVLSHHLSWVPTVLPSAGNPMGWRSWKVSSTWSKDLPQLPYNPFRMQLSDLYGGGGGLPLRVVKVLVMGSGTRSSLVSQFLFILSYFIRLSQVTKREANSSQVLTPEECELSVTGIDELISIPQDYDRTNQISDPFLCHFRTARTSSPVGHTYEIHGQTKVKFIVGEDDREVIEECGIMLDITERKLTSEKTNSKLWRTHSFNERTSSKSSSNSVFKKLSHSKTAPHMPVRMTCSVPTPPHLCQHSVHRGRRCSDTIFSSSQYLRDYQNLRFSFGHQDDMLHLYLSDSYDPRVVLDGQVLAEARNTFCEQSFHWLTHCPGNFCDHGDVIDTRDESDLLDIKEGVKQHNQLGIILCPLPRFSVDHDKFVSSTSQAHTLYSAYSDHYIPDVSLLGLSNKSGVLSQLHQDLVFTSQHSLHCETKTPTEALCILADVDNWSVELISSQSPHLDHGSSGVTLGMSPLVSSLLETTCQMWKVGMPAQTCLVHLESRLQELYCQSKVMADYLLTHQVADMNTLTSDLDIAVNDVPLLLAIATTHTPLLASLYGIGFK